MLITHCQFFLLLLNKNLNIPNRWYFPNNTFRHLTKINIIYYIKKFKFTSKSIDTIYFRNNLEV